MSAGQRLRPETKQPMQSTHGRTEIFNDGQLIRDIAKFALRCHNTRFPEEEVQKGGTKKEKVKEVSTQRPSANKL